MKSLPIIVRQETPTLCALPEVALHLGKRIWRRVRAERRKRLLHYLRHQKPHVHVARLSPTETVESNLPI